MYVNHAATSPLSMPVTEAVEGFMAERQGRAADAAINNFASFQEVWAATRQQVAELLSTEASRIAYTSNTSSGLNVFARGLDWQPGDRVAVPGPGEFPADVYPSNMNLEAQGVTVDLDPARGKHLHAGGHRSDAHAADPRADVLVGAVRLRLPRRS
ncbi:MAG: aminotransferase class V-fold PLP-dependent enzyme [Gammaproteobacteria bacterium]|nr:aminotransferase class V-fold PLP-dependent enzyme [Gammaproteobacteria bacterium]